MAAACVQALDAWLQGSREGLKPKDHAAAVRAALAAHEDALAPPLDAKLAGVKLTKKQRRALQDFRDLYVCVRSEAARYGADRCAPSHTRALQRLQFVCPSPNAAMHDQHSKRMGAH